MAIWHEANPDPQRMTRFARDFMSGHLGIEFIEIGENWLKARMPVNNRTCQPHGRLQGGASAALAESIASAAGLLTCNPEVNVAVGLKVEANHCRPVSSGYVYGVATPEHLGRTTQLWSVRIRDGEDRMVCFATVTLSVIPAAQSRVNK